MKNREQRKECAINLLLLLCALDYIILTIYVQASDAFDTTWLYGQAAFSYRTKNPHARRRHNNDVVVEDTDDDATMTLFVEDTQIKWEGRSLLFEALTAVAILLSPSCIVRQLSSALAWRVRGRS